METPISEIESPDRNQADRLLAKYQGRKPAAPSWFSKAMAALPPSEFVEVEGAAIEYLCWGKFGNPGILLMPGGRAHAHWWAPIAPFLSDSHRVVALSFSGMGGSGWRGHYSIPQYAREAKAVAGAAGLFPNGAPLVVAHSFGASPASVALADGWPRGGIIVDASVDTRPGLKTRRFPQSRRHFLSMEEALARYRLLPRQDCENDFIADAFARHSLRRTFDGWEWSYDPEWLTHSERSDSRADLKMAKRPIAFVYGDRSSIVTGEALESLRNDFLEAPFVEIPASGHHVMIDQPLALVAGIKGLLAAGFSRD